MEAVVTSRLNPMTRQILRLSNHKAWLSLFNKQLGSENSQLTHNNYFKQSRSRDLSSECGVLIILLIE